mmetsp:Transcript_41420/g.30447  ORF Transcript_41420/g.30447 Transcript_41420/m.30447 type:complete len:106 (+) Transcript_41420:792-1109(+)
MWNLSKISSEEKLKERATYVWNVYKCQMGKLNNEKGLIPYNMVLTNDWMFIVLRSKGFFENQRINTLNYLGVFLVMTDEEKSRVEEVKPLEILKQLSVPANQNQL